MKTTPRRRPIGDRLDLARFSAGLWRPAPPSIGGDRLTPVLDAALAEVTDDATRAAALRGWRRWRTLSTGPHVCPTYGPRFLAMDRIATAACPPDTVPIVAATSGVPFGNGAHPLSLCFTSPLERVVIPGTATDRRARSTARRQPPGGPRAEYRLMLGARRWRGGLVYGAPIPRALPDVLADLQPSTRALLADPAPGPYSTWALRTAAGIQSRVLGRRTVSIDLNRLIAAYLIQVADDAHHPIARLFHDARYRARWCARLPDDPWFLARTVNERGQPRFEAIRCVDDRLIGRTRRWAVDPGRIAGLLADRRLCPGLGLTYGILVAAERVRCLGGARQAAYLRRFGSVWRELGLAGDARPGPIDISGEVRDADGHAIFPFDLCLDRRTIDGIVPASTPMHRLRLPVADAAPRGGPPT